MAYDTKEKAAAYARLYRERNREKMRAYNTKWKRRSRRDDPESSRVACRKWRALHPKQAKEIQRVADQKRKHTKGRIASQYKYRAENPERVAAGWARWRERNPERFIQVVRACSLRRYARKCAASGSHTLDQWLQRVTLYGWRCAYCQVELTLDTLRKDHVKPLIAGGSDWPANLVPACGSCNSRKSRKRWIPRLP